MNCVKNPRVCNEYLGIHSFPSLVMVSRRHNLVQRFHDTVSAQSAQQVQEWAMKVAREWRWLFTSASVVSLNMTNFYQEVVMSNDSVVAMFTDGLACTPCRVAMTNLLRLSAGLRGLPVKVGVVDCSIPINRHLCYVEHKVPRPPHRPVFWMWRTGRDEGAPSGPNSAAAKPGEALWQSSDVEPHIALQLIERVLRLALADRATPPSAGEVAEGQRSDFEEDKEEEQPEASEPHPDAPPRPEYHRPPPDLLWEGQSAPKQLRNRGTMYRGFHPGSGSQRIGS